MELGQLLIAAGGAYLAGSIPFGLLIARVFRGVDIRQHGSGNIGATNVGRVLGAKWGIACLVLDALKGLLPVWLLPMALLAPQAENAGLVQVIAGVATIVGHMFPCWLKFKGGKGVATALGVVIVVGPWGSLAALGGFILGMLATRIVSVSSILAAVAFATTQMVMLAPDQFAGSQLPVAIFSLVVPALIIFRHRSNIGRLVRGEEPKFKFGKSSEAPSASS